MSAHTPGPWSINRHGAIVGGEFIEYTNGRGQSQIAMATGAHNISDQERDANGRLIAAAPDLLDAAEEALEAIADGDVQSARNALRAAIAKATGNSS